MARCLILLSAACGVGKSTVKNALNELNLLPDFACIDSDEVRLNWWNYKGTPREKDYTKDCLARAFELAGNKHLLFGTCNDPISFFERVPLPEDVTATYIGMTCTDAEVRRRLLAVPPKDGRERNPSSCPRSSTTAGYGRTGTCTVCILTTPT